VHAKFKTHPLFRNSDIENLKSLFFGHFLEAVTKNVDLPVKKPSLKTQKNFLKFIAHHFCIRHQSF